MTTHNSPARPPLRRRLVLPLLALGVALALVPGRSFASLSTCRTDPVVTLSNGHQVTLWASINSDISTVGLVTYVLHIPSGLSVTGVQYDQYGALEQFSWVADQKNNTFASTTTVQLLPGLSPVPVSGWMNWDVGNNTGTVSGQSGQPVTIQMNL